MSLTIIIGGKYELGRKIGSGSFGDIFLGSPPSNPFVLPPPRPAPICLLTPSSRHLAGKHVATGEEVAIKLVRVAPVRVLSGVAGSTADGGERRIPSAAAGIKQVEATAAAI